MGQSKRNSMKEGNKRIRAKFPNEGLNWIFVENFNSAWQWLMCPVEQTMACVHICKTLKGMHCDCLRLEGIEK